MLVSTIRKQKKPRVHNGGFQGGNNMIWTRRELKEQAKEALHRNYWKIVLVTALLFLLGCETGGFGNSTKIFNTESGKGTNAEQAAEAEKSIITVNEEPRPGEWVGQIIGNGEIEAENFEIDFLGGVLFGIIAIAIFMIIFLILFAVILAVDIFLINPFEVGGKRFMRMSVEGTAQVKEIAYGFDHSYKNVVKVLFYRDLYISLWTLLFIIPGIVKMYQYFLVPYILTEYPNMEYKTALQLSRDAMEGNKWKTFVLKLSFIPWDILGAFTFGILEIFYVNPYRSLTYAALYCKLKNAPVING